MEICLLEFNVSEVTEVVDVSKVVEMIRNSFFDLELPDIQFPGMGRLEVLQHIAENPASWQMGIVALTAQALGSDKELLIGGDYVGSTSQPVDVFKLMDVRHTFLSNGKA